MTQNDCIGILGAGAWGTALAQNLAANGRRVKLWARRAELAETINRTHRNADCLPDITLHEGVAATAQLADLAGCNVVLLATPAQYARAILKDASSHLAKDAVLVICAKGIETSSGARMDQVVEETLPGHAYAVLSGPSFAAEIAQGLPAAVTIAAKDATLATRLTELLGGRNLRPYSSGDVTGVLIGGALKNVLAIACGIVIGRGLGENARAALITRGLAEMTRLAVACGGRAETLMGLAGLGDLVLTCGSSQSRNMSLGIALGKGETLAAILARRHSVAEGVATSSAALTLAAKHTIDMPITAAVQAILHRHADIDATVAALLARPFKAE
jgi:glycerol-3-phosphate dehydrogenase (NAD(P)+)